MIPPMPDLSRRLLLFLAALATLAGLATPVLAVEPPIRLIVRGDDMGSSQASNEAVIRCFKDGVMRDVELMAVGPWFPEAARLLRENPGLDVGLHLTLTSEWDNVKWRPLTTAPSLVGRDGYFHPMIWPHPHYGKEGALKEQPWKLEEIERELRAQIELTKREVPHLSHLSDHMGFQALGPEVVALVKRLAGEYGLDIDPEALGTKWVGWNGKPETPAQKVESFVRVLEGLGSRHLDLRGPPRARHAGDARCLPRGVRNGRHGPPGCHRRLDEPGGEGCRQPAGHRADRLQGPRHPEGLPSARSRGVRRDQEETP